MSWLQEGVHTELSQEGEPRACQDMRMEKHDREREGKTDKGALETQGRGKKVKTLGGEI